MSVSPQPMPQQGRARDAPAAFALLLEPLSHPELGEIRIQDTLFPIGRNEAPFDAYPAELTATLSRRHARLFCEGGEAYVADLGSRNGTTVNGVDVREKTSRLKDGDEIRFGSALAYRIRLGKSMAAPVSTARLTALTLTPEHAALGLQTIVVTEFPFLIGKSEPEFARYGEAHAQQLAFLSRRHAHIFLRRGMPWIEDLGSTNGSYIDGKRLQEHAAPITDGTRLAFGGQHFAYIASLQREALAVDPTLTGIALPAQVPDAAPAAVALSDPEKTTFVAAAGSFLDIFCVTPAQDAGADKGMDAAVPASMPSRHAREAPRSMAAAWVRALVGDSGPSRARMLAWIAGLAAVVLALAATLAMRGGDEKKVRALLAEGSFERAAAVANAHLATHPDDSAMKALDTEAVLKGGVPPWLAALKGGRDKEVRELQEHMAQSARGNDDLRALLGELDWVARLRRYIAGRGGLEAPVRIYVDEAPMRELLAWWDADANGHQRQLSRIAAQVPAFRDTYAEALSHVRRLKSDDAVYGAAIERLNAALETELKEDRLDAVPALLDDYAEKYPRLGGLERIRADLALYRQALEAARDRRVGLMVALRDSAQFATPPFRDKFHALAAGPRFPPAELAQQYRAVAASWQAGNTRAAIERLEAMRGGAWSDAVDAEIARKKRIAEGFAALPKARGSPGQEERVLAFYDALNPFEDGWFLQAASDEIEPYRRQAQQQARELIERAEAQWRRYRDGGGIEGPQRLEATVSDRFRSQARLLVAARDDAQRGMRLLRQVRAEQPSQSASLQEQIGAELEQQRRALRDARAALDPAVYRAKLALLGGEDGERESARAGAGRS
ncbi:FHA domain-containing protein [Noviherbaspirillum pedocola]|uniref:FHA domain-containing protein n=1 Tax=Noviherbaspirillum pedocola TaxID=2801341 RepID=A0A934W5S9_9BURK|nr:FHA domain-containing protein [Noviherbaspirillum pedocola]MBK4735327.1 FHA domain-containing protein [Noviherbaspirillum pedocola]